MKKSLYKLLLFIYFFFAYALPTMADPNDPDAGENEDEQQASVDDWTILLLFAAVFLAAYFIYYKKNFIQVQHK